MTISIEGKRAALELAMAIVTASMSFQIEYDKGDYRLAQLWDREASLLIRELAAGDPEVVFARVNAILGMFMGILFNYSKLKDQSPEEIVAAIGERITEINNGR